LCSNVIVFTSECQAWSTKADVNKNISQIFS
jgi:hypothetical protein